MSEERQVKGSVKTENIFKESTRKEGITRLRWSINWQWYVDLLRERQTAIDCYKKSSPRALALCTSETQDERSVLPFPITTNMDYGWLSTRKEFALEVFGSYYNNAKPASDFPDAASSLFYSTSEG